MIQLVLQWYLLLILLVRANIDSSGIRSILKIHNQLGQLQTIIILYFMICANDYKKAYQVAISYYIFDIIQICVLRYRKNPKENIIFILHHLITLYVMSIDKISFRPVVCRLELSNIAFIVHDNLHGMVNYKQNVRILTSVWYSYFRVVSVMPFFIFTSELNRYEYVMWICFYNMGIYWSSLLLRRCFTTN